MYNTEEIKNPAYVRLFLWSWNRFRPNAGWLPFILVLSCVFVFVYSFVSAEWAPESKIISVNAMLALLLTAVLAQQPISARRAWLIILAYGIVLTLIQTARLLPDSLELDSSWPEIALEIRQDLALWLDRLNGWGRAVFGGGESTDTLPFIMMMALLAWLLAAFATWQTLRKRDPLTAVGLMGIAVTINAFFAGEDFFVWVALYLILALVLVGVMRFYQNEQHWRQSNLDYSTEIKTELFLIIASIAVVLIVVASALPNVRSRRLSNWFNNLPVVQNTEDAFSRAFVAIESRRRGLGSDGFRDGPGGVGILPREFLIGDAPELYETVMMTATVTADVPAPHWRGISLDTYTGRGWSRSDERTEVISAETLIPVPEFQAQSPITQTVYWSYDKRATRYTLGLPQTVDQEVYALWRGVDDLARIQSTEPPTYTVVSTMSAATISQLQGVSMNRVPLTIAARYTAIPDSMPARVSELAADVTAETRNSFDAAKAIEQFLRQYPYDLTIPPPDPGDDVVDYFLFDAQAGYCDYYASSMVMMARSVGIPARLAVGFLAPEPDENGVQTIRQIDGHSWAELYFPEYGWVEFEPTAPFETIPLAAGGSTVVFGETPNYAQEDDERPAAAPIPSRAPQQTIDPWLIVAAIAVVVLGIGGGIWFYRRDRRQISDVEEIFGRLQNRASKLGVTAEPSATPYEFSHLLQQQLERLRENRWVQRSTRLEARLDQAEAGVVPLVTAYVAALYNPQGAVDSAETPHAIWRRIRRSLWLLSHLN